MCKLVCVAKYEEFDKQLENFQHKFETLEQNYELYQKWLNVLESKTNSTPKTKFSTSPKPSPFKPTPTCSTSHVRQHFGPTKSPVINNNTIPQYFQKNNLCFDQQGDEFYLQDKDFIKNSPKIQPPDTEEDALTIYSQLQKKSYYIQYLHHFNW